MSTDPATDPFEALREPLVPLAPDPSFAAGLRRRLEARLGHTPTTTREDPTMPTTTTPTRLRPLVPYLTCTPAADAIEWYQRAFGATLVGEPFVMEDGRVGHAELLIGDSAIFVSDQYEEVGAISPTTAGASTAGFVVEVADVDAAYQRAVDAGAAADRPPSDQFHGSRSGWLTDPFGHRWSLSTPLGTERT